MPAAGSLGSASQSRVRVLTPAAFVEAVAAEYGETSLTVHGVAPSTILYGPEDGHDGVQASTLVDCCLLLASEAGEALNGETIESFT